MIIKGSKESYAVISNKSYFFVKIPALPSGKKFHMEILDSSIDKNDFIANSENYSCEIARIRQLIDNVDRLEWPIFKISEFDCLEYDDSISYMDIKYSSYVGRIKFSYTENEKLTYYINGKLYFNGIEADDECLISTIQYLIGHMINIGIGTILKHDFNRDNCKEELEEILCYMITCEKYISNEIIHILEKSTRFNTTKSANAGLP